MMCRLSPRPARTTRTAKRYRQRAVDGRNDANDTRRTTTSAGPLYRARKRQFRRYCADVSLLRLQREGVMASDGQADYFKLPDLKRRSGSQTGSECLIGLAATT